VLRFRGTLRGWKQGSYPILLQVTVTPPIKRKKPSLNAVTSVRLQLSLLLLIYWTTNGRYRKRSITGRRVVFTALGSSLALCSRILGRATVLRLFRGLIKNTGAFNPFLVPLSVLPLRDTRPIPRIQSRKVYRMGSLPLNDKCDLSPPMTVMLLRIGEVAPQLLCCLQVLSILISAIFANASDFSRNKPHHPQRANEFLSRGGARRTSWPARFS
jgi:hypothetical protein